MLTPGLPFPVTFAAVHCVKGVPLLPCAVLGRALQILKVLLEDTSRNEHYGGVVSVTRANPVGSCAGGRDSTRACMADRPPPSPLCCLPSCNLSISQIHKHMPSCLARRGAPLSPPPYNPLCYAGAGIRADAGAAASAHPLPGARAQAGTRRSSRAQCWRQRCLRAARAARGDQRR